VVFARIGILVRSMRCSASLKYVGLGRLYGIILEICMVPATVVPDSIDGLGDLVPL